VLLLQQVLQLFFYSYRRGPSKHVKSLSQKFMGDNMMQI